MSRPTDRAAKGDSRNAFKDQLEQLLGEALLDHY